MGVFDTYFVTKYFPNLPKAIRSTGKPETLVYLSTPYIRILSLLSLQGSLIHPGSWERVFQGGSRGTSPLASSSPAPSSHTSQPPTGSPVTIFVLLLYFFLLQKLLEFLYTGNVKLSEPQVISIVQTHHCHEKGSSSRLFNHLFNQVGEFLALGRDLKVAHVMLKRLNPLLISKYCK